MKRIYIFFRYIGLSLVLALSILCVNACTKECRSDTTETQEPKKNSISISDSHYAVQFDSGIPSEYTNEIIDRYTVMTNDDAVIHGTIDVNPVTGEIIHFYGIKPYPCIQNIQTLCDEEIRETVEQQLKGFVDFSAYNTFVGRDPVLPGGRGYLFPLQSR